MPSVVAHNDVISGAISLSEKENTPNASPQSQPRRNHLTPRQHSHSPPPSVSPKAPAPKNHKPSSSEAPAAKKPKRSRKPKPFCKTDDCNKRCQSGYDGFCKRCHTAANDEIAFVRPGQRYKNDDFNKCRQFGYDGFCKQCHTTANGGVASVPLAGDKKTDDCNKARHTCCDGFCRRSLAAANGGSYLRPDTCARLKELEEFKKETGHCNVPHSHPNRRL